MSVYLYYAIKFSLVARNFFLNSKNYMLNVHGWQVLGHALANISAPATFGLGSSWSRGKEAHQ